MSINFNAALNAYNNAAKISTDGFISDNAAPTPDKIGGGFAGAVNNSITNSFATIRNAEGTVAKSLVKQADITDVVMAISNAELTLKTVIEVRDRLLAAHQDIMKIPI
jgi:flagellar hook-basal body complex protein FliE